jgi:tetratricopeptide (TPR) repeat protein
LFSLFEGYTYPEKKKNGEGLDSLKSYYARISKRVGYNIKYPVKTLLTIGQRLLKENKIDEAIQLFELNAGHNPEVWDSNFILAYLYLKTGKQELSKQYYLKAKKIYPDHPNPEFQEMKRLFN